MADRGIIFSAPMVRALLDGRKSQTRRVLKPQPNLLAGGIWYRAWPATHPLEWSYLYGDRVAADCAKVRFARGDRLWVREAWRVGAWHYGNGQIAVDYKDGPRKEWLDAGDHLLPLIDQSRDDAQKAGTALRHSYYEYTWSPGDGPCRWRSPIHMPRWASRLTLTVTDVRLQRLGEITEADAIAEGCPAQTLEDLAGMDPRGWYRDLWNSLHGADAWDANPWVAAYSFTTEQRNIDHAG